jgi:hypothetical protein
VTVSIGELTSGVLSTMLLVKADFNSCTIERHVFSSPLDMPVSLLKAHARKESQRFLSFPYHFLGCKANVAGENDEVIVR